MIQRACFTQFGIIIDEFIDGIIAVGTIGLSNILKVGGIQITLITILQTGTVEASFNDTHVTLACAAISKVVICFIAYSTVSKSITCNAMIYWTFYTDGFVENRGIEI